MTTVRHQIRRAPSQHKKTPGLPDRKQAGPILAPAAQPNKLFGGARTRTSELEIHELILTDFTCPALIGRKTETTKPIRSARRTSKSTKGDSKENSHKSPSHVIPRSAGRDEPKVAGQFREQASSTDYDLTASEPSWGKAPATRQTPCNREDLSSPRPLQDSENGIPERCVRRL